MPNHPPFRTILGATSAPPLPPSLGVISRERGDLAALPSKKKCTAPGGPFRVLTMSISCSRIQPRERSEHTSARLTAACVVRRRVSVGLCVTLRGVTDAVRRLMGERNAMAAGSALPSLQLATEFLKIITGSRKYRFARGANLAHDRVAVDRVRCIRGKWFIAHDRLVRWTRP